MQHEVREFTPQSRKFREPFLHPILTEEALPGSQRLAHRLGRLRLADGDQRYPLGGTTGSARGRLDSAANRGKIAADCS